MTGSPPPGGVIDLSNWWDPPNARWSFLHTREIMPSALVSRGAGPVWELPRDDRDLEGLRFELSGRTWSLQQIVDTTYIDGLMVLHRGHVVFERYIDGMGPRTRHICQSVSKSLTSTLAGVLIGDGLFDDATTVPDVIPELAGTCWDGCTIGHLLDMRAGVEFDESDYEDEDSGSWRGFRILGWMPPDRDDPDPAAYIAAMRNQGPHGGPFEYRSILTDVLGWAIERATGQRLADAFARRVWGPMGAADDADLLIGRGWFPLVDGGFCVTLPDLARFGLLHLRGGLSGERRVLPEGWTDRVTELDPDRASAFGETGWPDGAYYRDQWWVIDPARRVRSGFGIHGQQVLVHGDLDVVVARFSSQPRPSEEERVLLAQDAMLAIAEAVAGA